MGRTWLKTMAGFAAALGIIGLFTWQVGWSRILNVLARADPAYAAPASLVAFAGIVLLGVTWWIPVREVADIGIVEGIRVFYITYFANSVTPLGQFGGEPFIAYILSKDADIPMEEAFGAVIVADIINAVPFFTMSLAGMAVFLLFFPLSTLTAQLILLVAVLLAALAATVAAVLKHREEGLAFLRRAGAGIGSMAAMIPHDGAGSVDGDYLEEKGRKFFDIVDSMVERERMLARALVFSHLASLAGPVALYLFLLSLGVPDPVFSALLFIVPASMLAGFLPLPGGLGGIEVAMAALLVAVTAVPAPAASAGVLLLRFITYWVSLLIGGYLASISSVGAVSAGPRTG